MPDHVEEDDLRQYGVLGLMRAIRNYDPATGHEFSKYAVTSIRGVILDELRSLDWAPRSLRKRQRDLAMSSRTLKAELGRDPSLVELSQHLGWTTNDVVTTRRQVDNAMPKSLDEMRGAYERTLHDTVESRDYDPEAEAIREKEREERDHEDSLTARMGEFIESLPEHERAALVMVYYLGLTPAEVQRALGMAPERVAELHDEVREKIRVRLEELLQAGS
jgi:RNA polymerase sigma factor for flagellar operon FliA